ncbi:unnamed protein product [Caenorhabditis auriculariae]|uniref:Uncharacterized protein n=1 Tax=Caenorhabditis auriculariae TaxID=2777116 RepID=A0A8S1HBN7_9PELO|nr:unnamed protein product [Caenorhabditis auriculariae]
MNSTTKVEELLYFLAGYSEATTTKWRFLWQLIPWICSAVLIATIFVTGCAIRNCDLHLDLLSCVHFSVCTYSALLYIVIYIAIAFKYVRKEDIAQAVVNSETPENVAWREMKWTMQFSGVLLLQWLLSVLQYSFLAIFASLYWANMTSILIGVFKTAIIPVATLVTHEKIRVKAIRLFWEEPTTQRSEEQRPRMNSIGVSPIFCQNIVQKEERVQQKRSTTSTGRISTSEVTRM